MMVPCLWPRVYLAKVAGFHLPRVYSWGVKSSVIAWSRAELSIVPPIYLPPSIFEITVTLSAQDNNASFPMPFLPINGRPVGECVTPSFLFEYPIFRHLF